MDAQPEDELQRTWRDSEYGRTISKDQLLLFSLQEAVHKAVEVNRCGGECGVNKRIFMEEKFYGRLVSL